SNPLNLLMMHKTKSPKPLKSYNPSVSPLFESICLKCLAKNPSDRFQNMKEFINALQDAIRGKSNNLYSNKVIDLPENIKSAISASDGGEIPNPDIPPEKIQEVRKELFVDSNSVWFDPYSKPQEEKKDEQSETNEKPSSIIIDISAAEKALTPEPERPVIKRPESEELLLVTEVKKPVSPVPKVHIPIKEKVSAVKKSEKPINLDSFFTKRNILIALSSVLFISFVLGIIIYKVMTSGTNEELKREIKFNTPLPVNPNSMKQEERNDGAEIKEGQVLKTEESQTEERRKKAVQPRQEKPQPQKNDRPQSASDFFIEANNYFKQGKYDMAAEYYKSAIRLKPDFAMAYRGLGACYAMLGKADLSIKQYEKYIELDPNGPDVDKVINIINEYRSRKK
ncbi:MAG: tetratricopeptide repeat protein, partial [Deltaproteobacteria bacterium]|nr:tetratricopeptide repeat protein [Deltaproteobacteria bacterium]